MKTTLRTTLIAAAAAGACFMASAAEAKKPVELRFAHWVPSTHAVARLAFDPWAKSIEEASNGSIKVTFYPAQQLGKSADHYDMARTGIADMTWVSPGYQAGRFPMFAATELPLLISKGSAGSQAVDAWYRDYAKEEMKDVKFCLAHVHMGAIHARNPIRSPEDLKGLKVRSSSGTLARAMTLLGASNVQLSSVDARDAIERGVADMLTFPWSTLFVFGIDKSVKYHTNIPIYAGSFVWVMNQSWYDRLDDDQRVVIDSHCSQEWALKAGGAYADWEDEGRETLRQTDGHTVIDLEPNETQAWKTAVVPVSDSWAEDVRKLGKDPKAILDALKEQLSEHGALY